MNKDFEIIPHTADLKIRVYGKTIQDLFKNALIGMFQAIKPINGDCIYKNERIFCANLTEEHEIELGSPNQELLLVDFLSECLYLSDLYNEAYLDVELEELTQNKIMAKIKGVKISGFEVVEIKAVTYHDLHIKKENDYFVTDIVLDI